MHVIQDLKIKHLITKEKHLIRYAMYSDVVRNRKTKQNVFEIENAKQTIKAQLNKITKCKALLDLEVAFLDE